jgi:predicted lysophospholipase L1 biosynthesis ABC-type transport system permease subunit
MTAPDRRARTRPLELLVLSGVLAAFAGLVVFMSTKALLLSLIALGGAFIVALVVFAMIALAMSPPDDGTPPPPSGDAH